MKIQNKKIRLEDLQQQGSKCVKPKIEKRKIELVGDMQH
jgi:hypothetical protein